MSYQQTRRGNGSETGSSRPRRRETTPEDALAPWRPGVRDSGGDGPSTVVGTVEKNGPAGRGRRRAERTNPDRRVRGQGLHFVRMVELGGLEPPTSWVRSRRSPN